MFIENFFIQQIKLTFFSGCDLPFVCAYKKFIKSNWKWEKTFGNEDRKISEVKKWW